MIICITGPTAVGKTKLSVELAKHYNAEIINADSAQVYRKLDIGTAKITEEEKDGICHHLFDIVDIDEEYNVFLYQKQARALLDKLLSEGKNVIIVGGTGLYIKALLYDYRFKESTHDNDLMNLDNDTLYDMVKKLDSDVNIDKANKQRMISYINNFDEDKVYNKDVLLYEDVKFICLTTNREVLYNKINNRVITMMDMGLIKEVEDILKDSTSCSVLNRIIGYKEVISYLNEEISYERCVELIKQNSRHYAKRQFTWFKHQMDLTYVETNYDNFDDSINKAIEIIGND